MAGGWASVKGSEEEGWVGIIAGLRESCGRLSPDVSHRPWENPSWVD